jgi:hypothetical protein
MAIDPYEQIVKDYVKSFNPEKIIFYFDGKYHAVRNNWLTEIPSDEAEQILRDPEWDLWTLGYPTASKPPESCPSWIYRVGNLEIPVGEFLQKFFILHFRASLIISVDKN